MQRLKIYEVNPRYIKYLSNYQELQTLITNTFFNQKAEKLIDKKSEY